MMYHDSLGNNSGFSIQSKAGPTSLCSGWKVTRALLLLSLQSEVTSVLYPWASDIMVYENVTLPGSHRKLRGILIGKGAYKMIRTLSLSPLLDK